MEEKSFITLGPGDHLKWRDEV